MYAALASLAIVLPARAEADVYWLSGYVVGSEHHSYIGCASTDGSVLNHRLVRVSGGADIASDIAVNEEHIYWTGGQGSIGRADIDGTGVTPNFISANAWGLALDSSYLYWSDPTASHFDPVNPDQSYSGRIGRANLDGGGGNPDFIRGLGGYAIDKAIAVDSDHFYFATYFGIGRANLDGGGPHTFIENLTNNHSNTQPEAVAVSENHIYWTNYNIGRANVDGTGVDQDFMGSYEATHPTELPSMSHEDLAVHSGDLYWTYDGYEGDEYFNGVGRASLGGTGAELFVDIYDDGVTNGRYHIEQVAVGAASASCPPADVEVEGTARAAQTQAQARRKIAVKVEVDADEDLVAKGGGSVKSGPSRSYRLESQTEDVPAGESQTLQLSPRKGGVKALAKALKQGRRAEATVWVEMVDESEFQNSTTEELSIKLTRARNG